MITPTSNALNSTEEIPQAPFSGQKQLQKRQSRFRNVFKIVLGIGILGFLVYKIDPESLWNAARSADPIFLLAATLLVPVNIAIETLVWKSVLVQMDVRHPFRFLFGSVMAGFSLGAITPARVGEFAGRAYYLDSDQRWRGAFALAISRQPELSILGIAGCAGLLHLISTTEALPAAMSAVLGFGIIATIFVTAISVRPALIGPLTRRFGKYVSIFPAGSLSDTLPTMNLGSTFVYSLVRYVVYTAQFILLIVAFGISVSPVAMVATTATIFLIRFLIPPVTFMDLGIREGATVYFFGLLGASTSAAFNAAFLLFVLNIALPAIAGLWYVRRLVPSQKQTV